MKKDVMTKRVEGVGELDKTNHNINFENESTISLMRKMIKDMRKL